MLIVLVFIEQICTLNLLDPIDFTSNMQYFLKISLNSLKIPPNIGAFLQSQSVTQD